MAVGLQGSAVPAASDPLKVHEVSQVKKILQFAPVSPEIHQKVYFQLLYYYGCMTLVISQVYDAIYNFSQCDLK